MMAGMGWRWFSLVCTAMCAAAAEPVRLDMVHRNWTSVDGLPQERVRSLLVSRDGFVWAGTDAGLAHFDGAAFKTYGLRDGLAAVTVNDLLEARDGALWIGTLGGGVSVLRNGRIERTYTNEDGLPLRLFPTIAEDGDGVITVSGEHRLDGGLFTTLGPKRPPGIGRFLDSEGTQWLTNGGGKISHRSDGKWRSGSGGGPMHATAFCEDATGNLWIADPDRRLWRRSSGKWQSWPLPLAEAAITSIAAAPDGVIWMAYFRAGLFGFRDGVVHLPSIADPALLTHAEVVRASPDGVVWVGTSTEGLIALTPRKLTPVLMDVGDEDRTANFIGALAATADGGFLVGSQGRGLFRWKDGVAIPAEELLSIRAGLNVNCILPLPEGGHWIGTNRGIWNLRAAGGLDAPPAGSKAITDVWDFCRDGENGGWVGRGTGGLHRLPGGEAVNLGSPGPIKGMAKDSDGTLWVGTRGDGLFSWKDGQATRFGRSEGLGSEVIRVLSITGDGTLWVGTAGGGLAALVKGRFVSVTTENGLPDDVVSQIAEDEEGRLWVGTNRGLAVIGTEDLAEIRRGERGRIHPLLINRADGMIAEETTIVPPVRMADGRMAFAGTRGFTILKQSDFRMEPIRPAVFIERMEANGGEVAPQSFPGGVTIPPGSGRIEIGYTGLHHPAPGLLRFRTRLWPMEEDWSEERKTRSVEYLALPPGKYRFEVDASIGNGLWSNSPAAIEFRLMPRFWQTLWFRIVIGLATLSAVASGVRSIEKWKSKRRLEAMRRQQAVQEERARIARDLHDDVGSSLTQIALLSELADGELQPTHPVARSHINEIFTTAKEVTRSLDEIVWAVNPAQDTLERFADFLANFVQGYSRSAGLVSRIEIPDQLPDTTISPALRHNLYLATKETLHNVVKHAGASEIRLRLRLENGSLVLLLEDDGMGFETSAGNGDGLDNLRSRMAGIGGDLRLTHQPENGTAVELRVPLGGE